MPLRTRLIVASLLALLVAGCGGSSVPERASAPAPTSTPSGVNGILAETFNNLGKLQSGNVDLKLDITPSAGNAQPVSAHLSGPFASQGAGKLPRFAFTAQLQSGGKTVDAGATFTGGKGFVSLQGRHYALDSSLMQQITTAYQQSQQQGQQKSGLVLSTLGVDFSKWLTNPRNEGTATVGDAQTIKVSGDADVAQVIDDLDKVAAKARALNLPGASGALPQQLTPAQKQQEINAIKNLSVTVYTGAQDKILRRLVVSAQITDSGSTSDIGLDLTFTDVGKPQTIATPRNAKPFSDLQKAMQAAGISLGTGLSAGSGDGGGNNVDQYAQCIEKANGDQAKGRKCAALLTG